MAREIRCGPEPSLRWRKSLICDAVCPLVGEGDSCFRGKEYLGCQESQGVRVSPVNVTCGQVASTFWEGWRHQMQLTLSEANDMEGRVQMPVSSDLI